MPGRNEAIFGKRTRRFVVERTTLMTSQRRTFRILTPFITAAALVYACGDSGSGSTDTTTTTTKDAGTTKKDGSSTTGDADTTVDTDSGTTKKDSGSKDTGTTADVDLGDADLGDASGDGAVAWPDCLSQPGGVPTKAITDVWTDNASTPTQVWIPGAIITGVSRGGCAAGQACQIYVQSAATFASLAAGAHHAIKISVSSTVAFHFTGVAVGDVVDVLGWGWRNNQNGLNEIMAQVNAGLPGCTNKTGTATPTPITGVKLSDLTHASYDTYGPLLVNLAGISGKPTGTATQTFGLYTTGTDAGFLDGGTDIVSLSPFFLPSATFTDPPVTQNVVNAFSSVTGVFGTFTPLSDAAVPTYLELYPRTSADISK